jgi:hypothetical protein
MSNVRFEFKKCFHPFYTIFSSLVRVFTTRRLLFLAVKPATFHFSRKLLRRHAVQENAAIERIMIVHEFQFSSVSHKEKP